LIELVNKGAKISENTSFLFVFHYFRLLSAILVSYTHALDGSLSISHALSYVIASITTIKNGRGIRVCKKERCHKLGVAALQL